jgi:preprotein translocase subunit Sss1
MSVANILYGLFILGLVLFVIEIIYWVYTRFINPK